jgi:zinc-binding alcohol dehydrogenase family protein
MGKILQGRQRRCALQVFGRRSQQGPRIHQLARHETRIQELPIAQRQVDFVSKDVRRPVAGGQEDVQPGVQKQELGQPRQQRRASQVRCGDDAQGAVQRATVGRDLPLTTLTAYELLFDRIGVPKGGGKSQTLLVVGGAGGVGSILIQIARQMTQLTVVATASREETCGWCLEPGAHKVIDHSKPLFGELKAAGIGEVDFVASLTQTPRHYPQLVESLKPQGRLGVIDDLVGCDITLMKTKALSLHYEMMFTQAMVTTPDIAEQGRLLGEVARLIDAGGVRSTANAEMGSINAANLRKAHAQLESGKTRGKVVLAGF